MPIRSNSAYNDPALGAAFESLAQAFAPPSGANLSGYASAALTRQNMVRQKAAFDRIQAGNGTAADYAAAGIANPSKAYAIADMYHRSLAPGATPQSLDASSYAVNGNANNTFAGQGNKLASDERIAAGVEHGKIVAAGMAPVANNAVRYVPPAAMADLGIAPPPAAPEVIATPTDPSVAAMFGPGGMPTPPAPPAAPVLQQGNVTLAPGETMQQPDGTRLSGAEKPKTLDEVKAEAAGKLTPGQLRAVVMSGAKTQNVQTPAGPRIAYNSDAVGQAPAYDPTKAGKPELRNYQAPNGAQGSARYDTNTNAWLDVQTGQPIPQGSKTFGATLTGGAKETGLGPTTSNVTNANLREAELGKTRALLDDYRQLVASNPGVIGAVGSLRGFAQDMIQSVQEGAQAFSDDPQQFDAVVARVESLAKQKGFDPAIAKAEFLRHVLSYRLAKTQNPSGEVNVRELVLNKDALGGGMWSNQKSAAAKLDEFSKMLDGEQQAITTLRGAGAPAPTAAAPSGEVEHWTRGPDGKLMRAQ